MTKNGNFLIAHLDLGKVVEYADPRQSAWLGP
jgi:hypothetical protein